MLPYPFVISLFKFALLSKSFLIYGTYDKIIFFRYDESILVKVELPQFSDEPDIDNLEKWEEAEDTKEAFTKR